MPERFFHEDGRLIHHRQVDVEPTIDRVAALKSQGITGFGEHRFVGSVPMPLVAMWLKEAGVSWEDHEGMRQVVDRKLKSGDFSKFRVHEGNY